VITSTRCCAASSPRSDDSGELAPAHPVCGPDFDGNSPLLAWPPSHEPAVGDACLDMQAVAADQRDADDTGAGVARYVPVGVPTGREAAKGGDLDLADGD
jgi:hypothetical protein